MALAFVVPKTGVVLLPAMVPDLAKNVVEVLLDEEEPPPPLLESLSDPPPQASPGFRFVPS